MRSTRLWLLLAIAFIPLLYSISRITDMQFLDNFMSNWFATMIGAVMGIPIALEINRWQQESQDQKELKVR